MYNGVSQLATALFLSCIIAISCACFLEETRSYLAMCVCRVNTDLCLIVRLSSNIVCYAADYRILCIHTDTKLSSDLINHVINISIM